MPSIVRTICPLGVYTLISNGNANCTFTVDSMDGGRLASGSSLPAPDAANYKACVGGEQVALGSLGTTKLYWKPNRSDQVIEAMVG